MERTGSSRASWFLLVDGSVGRFVFLFAPQFFGLLLSRFTDFSRRSAAHFSFVFYHLRPSGRLTSHTLLTLITLSVTAFSHITRPHYRSTSFALSLLTTLPFFLIVPHPSLVDYLQHRPCITVTVSSSLPLLCPVAHQCYSYIHARVTTRSRSVTPFRLGLCCCCFHISYCSGCTVYQQFLCRLPYY